MDGTERFRPSYFRGSHGSVLVFDVTDENSVSHAELYLRQTLFYVTELFKVVSHLLLQINSQ